MSMEAAPSTASASSGERMTLWAWVLPLASIALLAAFWANAEWLVPSETISISWARLASRADALATTATLIAATVLVLFGLPTWSRRRAVSASSLVVILLLHLIAHGKLQEVGTDSHVELMRASAGEILDFLRGFVLVSGYNKLDTLALMAFAVVSSGLAWSLRRRTPRVVTIACVIILLLHAFLTNASLLPGFSTRRDSLETFEAILRATDGAVSPVDPRTEQGPNVVIYIGESTSRSDFERQRSSGADAGSSAATVEFSDFVTAHSHTFPSLFRALTVSSDHPGDRFRLEQETRRASVVKMLTKKGLTVEWYSVQAESTRQDWLDTLFGSDAKTRYLTGDIANGKSRPRAFDHEMVTHFIDHSVIMKQSRVVSFLHGFAGHWPYCQNIPEQWQTKSRLPWSQTLPPAAALGDLPLFDSKRHLESIACHEAATAYTRSNIQKLVSSLERSPQPTVIIYFSDHGEDPFDASAHDSSRSSPRHVEIPFVLHFNAAAMQRYSAQYRNAAANSRKPFSLDWFSHSLLDLAGLRSNDSSTYSVFSKHTAPHPRFALMREDVHGRRAVVAIDTDVPQRPPSVSLSGHDFFKKRLLLNQLAASDSQRVCGHRNDSLLKAAEAGELFSCLEMDIVIDSQHNQLHVVHPPKADNGLLLEQVLSLPSLRGRRIWLDVKNMAPDTVSTFMQNVRSTIPREQRSNVLIETENADPALRDHLRELVEDGFQLSYYVADPDASACDSADTMALCQKIARQVADVIDTMPFTDVSFDVHAYKFILQIPFSRPVMLNTWDLSARTKDDIVSRMSPRLRNFIVPYRSHFDY